MQGATRLWLTRPRSEVLVRQRNAGQKMGEDRSEKSKFQNVISD